MWSEAPESMIQECYGVVIEALKVEAEVPNWAKVEVDVDINEYGSRLAINRQSASS